MEVITFLSKKGGVGKTTLASILGAGLALENKRVLMIDADGQGDLSVAMGFYPTDDNNHTEPKPCFYDFAMRANQPLFDTQVLENSLIRRVPSDTSPMPLYVVTGNVETYGIVQTQTTTELALALLKRLQLVQDSFDYVIFDTQPSPTPLHEGILLMTDYVIVPTQPEGFSIKNLQTNIDLITEARMRMLAGGRDKARLLGIVPNQVRIHTKLHQEFIAVLDENDDYEGLVYEPVPLRTTIAEAQAISRFTMSDAPRLETNAYLWSFIDETITRINALQVVA